MMRGFCVIMGFTLLVVSSYYGEAKFVSQKRMVHGNKNSSSSSPYIVYMGSLKHPQTSHHASLLHALQNYRNQYIITQIYNRSFLGFAAHLTEGEAKAIAGRGGVVSVFRDSVQKLHTTHSWDYLGSQEFHKNLHSSALISVPNVSLSVGAHDIIIGVLDTGIWPESPSFSDNHMPPIPSSWKGICMAGVGFNSTMCNRKLIGARYYLGPNGSPRDLDGHGTFVASVAAGNPVWRASYRGLAQGIARGGSPFARIASYNVCDHTGKYCPDSAILKAFDDAIADGVDVISISMGPSLDEEDKSITTSITIGSFHAAEKGITVVCSAGNDGPDNATVVNASPWVLTVGATIMDREFVAKIMLGGNSVIRGGGINFSRLNKSPVYPLVDGGSAHSASSQHDLTNATNCVPGSLDGGKIKGRIVLCGNRTGFVHLRQRFDYVFGQGAIGIILIDNTFVEDPDVYYDVTAAAVTEEDGARILSYIKSTSKPLATILPTEVRLNVKPAPVVPYFSSRGPVEGNKNLLKPDVTGPGVAILGASASNKPPLFRFGSGTSMACPHVSGLASIVKCVHPTWSPSAIRSAIMTTAIPTNNLHAQDTTDMGTGATPFDIGAGQISLLGPLQPGLVYETETTEYLQYLCNLGYKTSVIRSMALDVPNNFSCLSNPSLDLVSQMNYPSIAISGMKANKATTVKRTVTNVGEVYSIYVAIVQAPANVKVQVVPNILIFTNTVTKLSFQVTFELTASDPGDFFGSITLWNWKYKVHSPFVVNVV